MSIAAIFCFVGFATILTIGCLILMHLRMNYWLGRFWSELEAQDRKINDTIRVIQQINQVSQHALKRLREKSSDGR